MTANSYPIGTPGQAWGAAEIALWRSKQMRLRSYADEVLRAVDALRDRFDVVSYGEVVYAGERFELMALRSPDWQSGLPSVLITGGVHGYETSGVQAALRFLAAHAQAYAGRLNLLVAPCVSPWAYERIQRWNFDAIDPNRAIKIPAPRGGVLIPEIPHGSLTFDKEKNAASGGEYTRRDSSMVALRRSLLR
jgi:hypothetical protein